MQILRSFQTKINKKRKQKKIVKRSVVKIINKKERQIDNNRLLWPDFHFFEYRTRFISHDNWHHLKHGETRTMFMKLYVRIMNKCLVCGRWTPEQTVFECSHEVWTWWRHEQQKVSMLLTIIMDIRHTLWIWYRSHFAWW